MEPPDHVAAVILAAGKARRFGSPKQLALLNGRTLLQYAVDAATDAGLQPIIAVIPPELPVDDADVTVVRNDQPALGMSHSIRLGFAALPPDAEAAMILLGDQPTVDAALIRRVVAVRGRTPFVATRAIGLLTPPVLVERSHFDVVSLPDGDIGLREILRRQVDLVTAVEALIEPADVDTPNDLARLAGRREE